MGSFLKKGLLAVVLIGLSAAAFGKPAHVLFHVGKKAAYPVRHPLKSSHSVWKFLTEVL
jgi:hypothetical protein